MDYFCQRGTPGFPAAPPPTPARPQSKAWLAPYAQAWHIDSETSPQGSRATGLQPTATVISSLVVVTLQLGNQCSSAVGPVLNCREKNHLTVGTNKTSVGVFTEDFEY